MSKWDRYANSATGSTGGSRSSQVENPKISFNLAPGDTLVVCPYEPMAHHILEARFTTHLTKCMRNYEAKRTLNPSLPKMIPCLFNWQHHIREPEYRDHLRDCPDAQNTIHSDPFAYCGGLPLAPAVPNPIPTVPEVKPEVVTLDDDCKTDSKPKSSTYASKYYDADTKQYINLAVHDDEDWEAEAPACPADQAFYDPKLVLDQKHVYFMPKNMAPADRKKYRARLVEQYKAEHSQRVVANVVDEGDGDEWF